MSTPKRNILQSERAFLLALSSVMRPFVLTLSYREAKGVGLGAAQVQAIKAGEPVNFTMLTVRRVCDAAGVDFAGTIAAAERSTHRNA